MTLLILFYLLFPAVLLWSTERVAWLGQVGPVILAYLFGILLGNLLPLPQGAAQLQDDLSGATVALALPLLLFSLDVKRWLHTAGKAILSMLGATLLVILVAGVGVFVIRHQVEHAWQFGGMAIGLYTGGTPNLAAIKTALDVDPTQFIKMHTYDAVNGIIYLTFVMSVGQRVFQRFLPAFQRQSQPRESVQELPVQGWRQQLLPASLGVLLSALIVGLSLLVAGWVPKEYETAAIMLLITSFGIAASFASRIRSLPATFDIGMYIILVFSLVVGSMANLQRLLNIDWAMMFFVNFVVFGTMLLHAGFARLFKIDTDTFLITSVSAVCSPPFVPVVAKALGNREIILSGLTTGIIGYAIGNYLGIVFAYVFRAIMGA